MENENKQKYSKTMLALAVGLAISSMAQAQTTTGQASPQPPADQSAAPTADSGAAKAGDVNTVVVTGNRASLAKSLDIKRNADIVLDSISATELGRFPDDDVADSLSHINGISISRTTGGDGSYVGVRGLSSEYNIVTLNNRILATDDDGRDLAFDVFPSDLISGADVLKSSQASAIEGSVGGTVNLKTASPFDDPGFHSAWRAEGNYNDMSYLHGSKYSGVVSDTTEDKHFGYIVGLVVSDTKLRTDSLNYNTYDPNNPGNTSTFGPSVYSGPNQNVVAPCCIAFGSVFDDKKRDALSGELEWHPNNEIKISTDMLISRLRDPQIGYNEAFYPDYTAGNWSNVQVSNGFVNGMTVSEFEPEFANITTDRVVTTTMFGVNASWKVTPSLTLTGDLYQSHAKRPEGGNDAFVVAGLGGNTGYVPDGTLTWQNTNGGLPNMSVTWPNGMNLASALASGQLTNANFQPHYVGLSGYSIDDKVTGASFDGVLALDNEYVDHFKFGMAYTDRSKSRLDVSNDWTGGSCQYCNLYGGPINFGQLGNNVISFTSLPNFMHGSGGSFPMTLVQFNVPNYLTALQQLNGQPNLQPGAAPGSVYNFSQTLPQPNLVNSYWVTEKTIAAYGEATMSGDQWNGNVGLRLVRTATTASTYVDNILSFDDATPEISTSSPTVNDSNPTPLTTTGSYIKPLPSVNFSYWLEHDLQMRLGAAEVMARPNLNQLAPTQTDGTINRIYEIYQSGNSQLKPITAFQQDFSLEWYYQPKSALTMALFSKQIKNFITTETLNNQNIGVMATVAGVNNGQPFNQPYSIQEPINGDRGDVYGIELGLQHLFDNGFGIHGQYTHNESKAWISGQYVGQLEGVSPSTASLGFLYEAGPISSDITWEYASSYVSMTETEVPGMSAIADPFQWLTASFNYQINKNLKVYIEGKNLTDSVYRTYLNGNHYEIYSPGGTPQTGPGYVAYGRFFKVGVGLKF